ncbi:T9SS type A sorting domain-containing protein [Labilibacter marinus]|uniref:T9SS type A sorting domain-containing protein n=1 Tax=Labilibacter marinus TaxID=1477105 RepID=UPI000835692D|nr:T9SS type A sorting domain-containing protein [Labilibacter marinus]
MKIQHYLFYVLFLSIFHLGKAEGDKVNILAPYLFGFESGGNGWWLQHDEYWQLSDEIASHGSYSLKYSNETIITDGSKKAHGSNLVEYPIVLDAGTYTMTLKVWIVNGTELTAFNTIIKDPVWTNIKWDIEGVEREKWVMLTQEVSFSQAINGSASIITMDQTYGGKGTFYIDEIAIWDDAPAEIEELPYTSNVNSKAGGLIDLEPGTYDVKTKVFIEDGTSISKFYTFINEPWLALDWDMESLAKDEWVELTQQLIIPKKVEQSEFIIQVNNNPAYGGGKGSIYIDDFKFEFVSSDVALGNTPIFSYEVFPNPSSEILQIKTPEPCTYILCNMLGKVMKSSSNPSSHFTIYVSDLPSGIYLLQLKVGNQRVVEKIKIN